MNKPESFAYSIAWNLVGAGIPLLFAFFAIPLLLAGYGSARFGFLTIIWVFIGYFSIFDFGLGRALTKVVSERLGSGEKKDIGDIIRTGLSVMFLLGIFACLLMLVLAPLFVSVLKIDGGLRHESTLSLRILALGLPFVIISAGLVGLLEAYAQFKLVNRIRLIMGLLNFGAPLLMMNWSSSLVPATVSLAVGRIATTIFYFVEARKVNLFGLRAKFQKKYLFELFSFGGWITVSNIVSPLMTQLDKVVIGGVISVSLLPLYSIPGDLVNRLSFMPVAMIGVFFPAFTRCWASGDRKNITLLYKQASNAMMLAIFPVAFIIYAFAPEGLALWVGKEFSQQATPLLRWLSIGLLINAIARIPHAFLQAIGKPDITAKLHLLELPVYAISLWYLLSGFGVIGAAIAWSGRMVLDFVLLGASVNLVTPQLRNIVIAMVLEAICSIIFICVLSLLHSSLMKMAACILIALPCSVYALRTLLSIKHHD